MMSGSLGGLANIRLDEETIRKINEQMEKEKNAKQVSGIAGHEGTPIYRRGDGYSAIKMGENRYGFQRPDLITQRTADGSLDERLKETLSDANQELLNYGRSYGDGVDSRETISISDSLQQLKDQATSDDWISAERAKRLGQADANANQAYNNAMNQVMMRGGASAGAGERMMANNMRANMLNRQGTLNELSLQDRQRKDHLLQTVGAAEQEVNRYNAGAQTNDMNRKLDALKYGGSVQQDLQRSNIGQVRADLDKENMHRMKTFQEDMAAWGSEKTADAQRDAAASSSGGGMSVICTAFFNRQLIDEPTYLRAKKFGNRIQNNDFATNGHSFVAYNFFMSKFVALMDKYRVIELIGLFLFAPFVRYVSGEKSTLGKVTFNIGKFVCDKLFYVSPMYLRRVKLKIKRKFRGLPKVG